MMNVKQKSKTIMRSYVLIILQLCIGTNLYSGEIFNFGYGYGMPFAETNNDISTYPDNTGTVYKPFNAFDSYNQLLMAPGDRPGFGEGIGVIPVGDNLLFLFFLIIVYGLRSKRRYTRNN